jgi:hypothetical protein
MASKLWKSWSTKPNKTGLSESTQRKLRHHHSEFDASRDIEGQTTTNEWYDLFSNFGKTVAVREGESTKEQSKKLRPVERSISYKSSLSSSAPPLKLTPNQRLVKGVHDESFRKQQNVETASEHVIVDEEVETNTEQPLKELRDDWNDVFSGVGRSMARRVETEHQKPLGSHSRSSSAKAISPKRRKVTTPAPLKPTRVQQKYKPQSNVVSGDHSDDILFL